MKKSVILIIAVIYVLAIVIVGFIGIRMRVYNENVYIESITCVSDGFEKYEEGSDGAKNGLTGHITTTYETGLKVLIKCEYYPVNANAFEGKPFKYISGSSNNYNVIENNDGTCTIEFKAVGSCDLIVMSNDSHKAEIRIRITALPDDMCSKYGIGC